MPDVEADDARWGGRLLPKLFWVGVGLAPLAGLLLLIGGGIGLRLGGCLGILSMVLIGLSIALRPDAAAIRLQLEETMLEEIDLLRSELREEIANSARATHQTVGERLGAVQQMIESLRTAPPASGQFVGAAPPPPRGAAAVPSAAPAFSGAHPVPPPSSPSGRFPAGAPVSGAPARTAGVSGRSRVTAGPGVGRRARVEREEIRPPVGRAAPTGGIYRHTETVQVTRSTYVDEHPVVDDRFGSAWSTVVPRSRAPEAFEESWTDEKLRERYGRRPRPYERLERDDELVGEPVDEPDEEWRPEPGWRPVSGAPAGRSTSGAPVGRSGAGTPGGRRGRRWADEPEPGDEPPARHSAEEAVSAGGRWASVRTDERGSELRVGERRASRHSYDDGSEVRIEDRWASVRRSANRDRGAEEYRGSRRGDEDLRRGGDDARRGGDDLRRGGDDLRRGGDLSDTGPGSGAPDYSRRALPASSSEPSWNDDWDEPVRVSRGHRYRDDPEDGDYGGGRQRRRLDFELTDERWR